MTAATVATTTLSKAALAEQLAKFVAALNEADAQHTEAFFSMLTPHTYEVVPGGRKFIKIARVEGRAQPSGYVSRSVHCFVEAATGRVAKAAGWKAPAFRSNGELQSKFSIATDESLADLMAEWDPYGGYLYVVR